MAADIPAWGGEGTRVPLLVERSSGQLLAVGAGETVVVLFFRGVVIIRLAMSQWMAPTHVQWLTLIKHDYI